MKIRYPLVLFLSGILLAVTINIISYFNNTIPDMELPIFMMIMAIGVHVFLPSQDSNNVEGKGN